MEPKSLFCWLLGREEPFAIEWSGAFVCCRFLTAFTPHFIFLRRLHFLIARHAHLGQPIELLWSLLLGNTQPGGVPSRLLKSLGRHRFTSVCFILGP